MIDLPPDPSSTCCWLICESGERWANAARRFAPQLMPPPWVASIVSARHPARGSAISAHRVSAESRSVLLWEIDPVDFSNACDSLASIAIEYPNTLRLAAASGLSNHRRMMISELAVAATIANPEDLPSLTGMLHAYFAMPGHLID